MSLDSKAEQISAMVPVRRKTWVRSSENDNSLQTRHGCSPMSILPEAVTCHRDKIGRHDNSLVNMSPHLVEEVLSSQPPAILVTRSERNPDPNTSSSLSNRIFNSMMMDWSRKRRNPKSSIALQKSACRTGSDSTLSGTRTVLSPSPEQKQQRSLVSRRTRKAAITGAIRSILIDSQQEETSSQSCRDNVPECNCDESEVSDLSFDFKVPCLTPDGTASDPTLSYSLSDNSHDDEWIVETTTENDVGPNSWTIQVMDEGIGAVSSLLGLADDRETKNEALWFRIYFPYEDNYVYYRGNEIVDYVRDLMELDSSFVFRMTKLSTHASRTVDSASILAELRTLLKGHSKDYGY